MVAYPPDDLLAPRVPSLRLGSDGKFTDGDPATDTPGSLDPAAWANMVTEELINLVQASGASPNFSAQTQVRDAVQSLIDARVPDLSGYATVNDLNDHANGTSHPYATTASRGFVRLATGTEQVAGAANDVATTPAGALAQLQSWGWATSAAPATSDLNSVRVSCVRRVDTPHAGLPVQALVITMARGPGLNLSASQMAYCADDVIRVRRYDDSAAAWTGWKALATTEQLPAPYTPPAAGEVGSHAFCRRGTSATTTFGQVVAGSDLLYSGVGNENGGSPPGSWECLGYTTGTHSTLYRRVA